MFGIERHVILDSTSASSAHVGFSAYHRDILEQADGQDKLVRLQHTVALAGKIIEDLLQSHTQTVGSIPL